MERAVLARNSRRYTKFELFMLIWAFALIALAVAFVPDLYWYSYYSVDYTLGFVRRGLAGEILHLFPDEYYFTALSVLRWLTTAVFSVGLAVLARAAAIGSGRSERRVLLALLIPLLPCGFAYGVMTSRPDTFGVTALICFMVAIKSVRSERNMTIASVAFGLVTAILTLAHEAIPLLFGLGALLALTVLAPDLSQKAFRLNATLATLPGLGTALTIAVLGKRGISKQVCEMLPHGPVNHPLAGNLTIHDVLHGARFEVDYHDWMCRAIAPFFDQTALDAATFVANLNISALIGSAALGMALLALTLQAVSQVSGVPFSRMYALMSKRRLWVLFGFVLFLPIFLMGADWTRWWVMITLNIGFVFVLFASGEQESAQPLTDGTRTAYMFAALILASPLGSIPGFAFPIALLL